MKKKWIPEEIINSYVKILNCQQRMKISKVCIENTYECHWFYEIGKEGFFFPMNPTRNHRYVGVLYMPLGEFQILNSLEFSIDKYHEVTKYMRIGIQLCLAAAIRSSTNLALNQINLDITKWPLTVIRDIPQQYDGCSCGIFAIKFMQLWDGLKLTSKFSQIFAAAVSIS